MELTPAEIEEKSEQLYDYVIRFIKDNRKYSEVKQFLMDDGLDEVSAKAVIDTVLILRKKKAKKEMQGGALVLLIGILVAVLGYILPFNGGTANPRLHLIIYGPIAIGAVMFLRGLSNSK